MAKLGIVIDDWMKENDLNATALQCWTSLQQNYGINVCTLMSMMSDQLMPWPAKWISPAWPPCTPCNWLPAHPARWWIGTTTTATTQINASSSTAATGPRAFLPDIEIKNAEILATTLGTENTYGAVAGRVRRARSPLPASAPMTSMA